MKTDNQEMAGIMSSPNNEGGCPLDDPSESISGETNRRSYKPAAMLGLALSVGTCGGLMLPHRSAMAVEVRASDSVSSEQPVSSDIETPKVAVVPQDRGVVVPSVAELPSPVMTDANGQHTVQDGETLWVVAESYGVDVKTLANANHLQPNAVLRVGQALTLPQHQNDARRQLQVQTVPMMVSLAGKSQANVEGTQTIGSKGATLKSDQETAMQVLREKRETLKQSLAELGGESTQVSSKANNAKASTAGFTLYLVSPGDTLAKIAQAHNVSYQDLLAFNDIDNPDQLAPNRVIKLPQVAPATELQVQKTPAIEASSALPAGPMTGSGRPASSEVAIAGEAQQQKLPDVTAGIRGSQESDLTAAASDASALNPAGQQDSQASSAQVALNGSIAPGMADAGPSASQATESGQMQEQEGSVSLPQPVIPSQTNSRLNKTSLIVEIQNLRQQYRRQASTATSRPVTPSALPVAAVKLAKASNPDFASRSSSESSSLSVELKNLGQQKQKPEGKATAAETPKSGSTLSGGRQVVARAVLGSEAYAPVVSPVQRMVAPNLPPLGRQDSYLPGRNAATGFAWPAKGVLTSGYGWRWGRMHRGVDIAGPVGTPIVAAAPGIISYAGWNDGGYGYMVEIEHADGSMTRYAHNSRLLVRPGQEVNQGQQISEMGSTGYSTGPHLHFEIHPKGQGAVNPMAFLDRNA